MRDYFSIFFSNTQVNSLISQPLDKWCSKASFSVLSPIYAKMWKAIFTKFSLILKTKRLFHNQSLMLDADQLFRNLIDDVQKLASTALSPAC